MFTKLKLVRQHIVWEFYGSNFVLCCVKLACCCLNSNSLGGKVQVYFGFWCCFMSCQRACPRAVYRVSATPEEQWRGPSVTALQGSVFASLLATDRTAVGADPVSVFGIMDGQYMHGTKSVRSDWIHKVYRLVYRHVWEKVKNNDWYSKLLVFVCVWGCVCVDMYVYWHVPSARSPLSDCLVCALAHEFVWVCVFVCVVSLKGQEVADVVLCQ